MKTLVLCTVVLVLLAASGCGTSAPSRLYLLESLPQASAATPATPAAGGVLLAVSLVMVPDYLDRPQIVTRSSDGPEIGAAEFDRWGEPLKQGLPRVVAENLSVLLEPEGFTVSPGLGLGLADYSVGIAVARFDGTLPGEVVLNATWGILDGKGQTVTPVTRAYIRMPIAEDGGYRALVAAQSKAVAELSRTIAAAAKGLKKPEAGR
jgi:uncharacterized protein